MKYFIAYTLGFFLTFGYVASTNTSCDVTYTSRVDRCKALEAYVRASIWPVYWPAIGSWYTFDQLLEN